jgi:Fe-S cluster assembly protein SufD
MEEKPKVVISRSRRPETKARDFQFTPGEIRTGALEPFRKDAWDKFSSMAFPRINDDAWRRTNLDQFPADEFRLPRQDAFRELPPVPALLLEPLVSGEQGTQIVLLPGGSEIIPDETLSSRGVIFKDLLQAEREHPELLARLVGQIVGPQEGKFAALASALSTNGILLYVPKNTVLDKPLHSLLWGPGVGSAHLSHILIWLDEGASASYLHEIASPDEDGASMHAGVVEILVGRGASLQYVELQALGRNVWNFTHARARVLEQGNLEWIHGAMGSNLTKSFSDVDLVESRATGRLSGFFFSDGTQHLDLDTQQNHRAPYTTSDLLYKGALKGKSRSIWQGMIYVAPGADKTDAYQANRNLVLSHEARADSIPGLEILADDVRCTHGATVGKLDEEQLFYLKSRGIAHAEAERLIVEGFFNPIMERIPYENVRRRFQDRLFDKAYG